MGFVDVVKEMVAGRKVRDKTLSLGTDLEQVLRYIHVCLFV